MDLIISELKNGDMIRNKLLKIVKISTIVNTKSGKDIFKIIFTDGIEQIMLTQFNTTLFSEYKSNQIVELDGFMIKQQVFSQIIYLLKLN